MQGRAAGKMKELSLTEAQQSQMKQMRKNYRSKMDDLEKNDKITLKEYRSRQAGLQKEMKTNMQSVLTPEQKTKMDDMRQQRSTEMETRMQKRLDRMKTSLSLSDDQYGQLKSKQQNMRSRISSIRENESLSFDQKRRQVRALKEEEMNEMGSVLNADQQKKLDEMKGKRKQQHGNRSMRKGPSVR